jgi:1-acyl-sn-glycerol-3-phosphate acyltransferase
MNTFPYLKNIRNKDTEISGKKIKISLSLPDKLIVMFGQNFAKTMLKIAGWKCIANVPDFDKCVLVVAPHTSNWDFLMGKLGYTALGRNANFAIKQEWLRGPIGWCLKKIGGIGVNRGKASHFTDQIAEIYRNRDRFSIAITPEGTRKRNAKWKKGFYQIALKANVPIVLVKIDYGKKELNLFQVFEPTGDEHADMLAIQQLYKGTVAKHPAQFAITE